MSFKLNVAVMFFLLGLATRIAATPLGSIDSAEIAKSVRRAAPYSYKGCPSFGTNDKLRLSGGMQGVFVYALHLIDVGTSEFWCTYEGWYTGLHFEKVWVQTLNNAKPKSVSDNVAWNTQMNYQTLLGYFRVEVDAPEPGSSSKARRWAVLGIENASPSSQFLRPDPARPDCGTKWRGVHESAADFFNELAQGIVQESSRVSVQFDLRKVNPRNFFFVKDEAGNITVSLLDCVPGVCSMGTNTMLLNGVFDEALSQATKWWPIESKRVGLFRTKVQGLCPKSAQPKGAKKTLQG